MSLEEYRKLWSDRRMQFGKSDCQDEFVKHLFEKVTRYSEILTGCMETMQSFVAAIGKHHSAENRFRDEFFDLEKQKDILDDGIEIVPEEKLEDGESDIPNEVMDIAEESKLMDGKTPEQIRKEEDRRMFGKVECPGNCEHCKNREGRICLVAARFGSEKPSTKQAKFAESIAKVLGIALPICKKKTPYSIFISANRNDFEYARATRVWQRDF